MSLLENPERRPALHWSYHARCALLLGYDGPRSRGIAVTTSFEVVEDAAMRLLDRGRQLLLLDRLAVMMWRQRRPVNVGVSAGAGGNTGSSLTRRRCWSGHGLVYHVASDVEAAVARRVHGFVLHVASDVEVTVA
uniref:Uncharacterized protein n=1 Tax=Aegilops tauschii TaxID=37682 RepID=M8BC01_AEGTA